MDDYATSNEGTGVSRSRTLIRRVRRFMTPSQAGSAHPHSDDHIRVVTTPSTPTTGHQPASTDKAPSSVQEGIRVPIGPRVAPSTQDLANAPELTEIDIHDISWRPLSSFPTANGAFGNIWRGQYDGKAVAMKQLRPHSFPEKARKRFYQEAYVWCSLRTHHSVLPLLGITRDAEGQLYMIAPWMKHGNLNLYLSRHWHSPDISRPQLLLEIMQGLNYLHENHVVHGDLRADNVLISDNGTACLSDFGLSLALDKLAIATHGTSLRDVGATRWMAPERFEVSSSGVSMKADIYSFAMVGIEIHTGCLPFNERHDLNDFGLAKLIQQGLRPDCPAASDTSYAVPGDLWLLMNQCWNAQPEARPDATNLLLLMRQLPLYSANRDVSPHQKTPRDRDKHPVVTNISGQVIRIGQYPAASGTFSTVWRGEWRPLTKSPTDSPVPVALKVLRVRNSAYGEMWRRLLREARILTPLKHENVVPLLGVTLGDDTESPHYCSLVSPWFSQGNITEYLAQRDPNNAERLRLTSNVASGLAYLHSQEPALVHSDLKPSNVLVDDVGRAAICDFGLSVAATDDVTGSSSTVSRNGAGAMRYAAPELFSGEIPNYTTCSDVWSFGCVAAEILYREAPYQACKNIVQMAVAISQGEKPVNLVIDQYHNAQYGPFKPRPIDVPRTRIVQCWSEVSEDRPPMADLSSFLISLAYPLPEEVRLLSRGSAATLHRGSPGSDRPGSSIAWDDFSNSASTISLPSTRSQPSATPSSPFRGQGSILASLSNGLSTEDDLGSTLSRRHSPRPRGPRNRPSTV